MTATPLPMFNAGELSPLLVGRTDIPNYTGGLRRSLNTVVMPHGPAMRRTGSRRAGIAHTTANKTVTFMFGVGDCYTLEFGDVYIRFWRADGSQVESAPGVPYQIASPWAAFNVPGIRWHQTGDILWIVHGLVPPQQLRRLTLYPAETFQLVGIAFKDGPYYPPEEDGSTLTLGGLGVGFINVASSTPRFSVNDVGRHLRVKLGTVANQNWAWGQIVAFVDGSNVTVNFQTEVASLGPSLDWRFGLYGNLQGWPAAITVHQERLALGSNVTNSFPRVDLSSSGNFTNFKPGTDDDNAIQIVIAADAVPVIRDLKSARALVIMTGAGLMRALGTQSVKMTPTDNEVATIDDTPGSLVAAVSARGGVLYLDAQGLSLGEVRATSQVYSDVLAYRELSIRNEHLLKDLSGVALAWAKKPWQQMLVARSDGSFLMGAYNPDQEVVALAPQRLGHGNVLSFNVLSTPTGDAIWMLVDHGDHKTLEVLTDQLANTQPDREAVNLDSSFTVRNAPQATLTHLSSDDDVETWQASANVFSGADVGTALRVMQRRSDPVTGDDKLGLPRWWTRQLRILAVPAANTIEARAEIDGSPGAVFATIAVGQWLKSFKTISGLSHLDGFDVRVLADGADSGPYRVIAGAITLPEEMWVATAGLPFVSTFQPMPPNPATKKGTTVAHPIGGRSRLRVVRSGGLKQVDFKGGLNGLMPLRRAADTAGVPPPFYSGDLELETLPDSDTPVAPFIVADGALPFWIAHFAPDYLVGEMG